MEDVHILQLVCIFKWNPLVTTLVRIVGYHGRTLSKVDLAHIPPMLRINSFQVDHFIVVSIVGISMGRFYMGDCVQVVQIGIMNFFD